MALTNIALELLATTEIWGLNIRFWIAMAGVALIVIVMNIVFWNIKPKI